MLSQHTTPCPAHHTNKCTYIQLCLQNALGTFLSLNKSELVPTQQIQFLGFGLDTAKQEVFVPQQKYNDTCAEINRFVDNCQLEKRINIKSLQRIRVSFQFINFPNRNIKFKGETSKLVNCGAKLRTLFACMQFCHCRGRPPRRDSHALKLFPRKRRPFRVRGVG